MSAFRDIGLMATSAWFSCPADSRVADIEGSEFPLSDAALRARFSGLLGDIRALVKGLDGDVLAAFADRSDSLTLDRNGVNTG